MAHVRQAYFYLTAYVKEVLHNQVINQQCFVVSLLLISIYSSISRNNCNQDSIISQSDEYML